MKVKTKMEDPQSIKDWFCEKCGKTFSRKAECEEHEKKCKGGLNELENI